MQPNRFFPFDALGFRSNPFRALTDEEWAEVVVVPPHVVGVLDGGYQNLQVLGEAGHGKTSLLLYLAAQLRVAGKRVAYERIPKDGHTYKSSLEGIHCFLLDEAQRLGMEERKRLMRQTRGMQVIVGSHEDISPLFLKEKRTLVSVNLDQNDRDHLKAVLERRLTYFSLKDRPFEPISDEMIDLLWGEYGRNIRAVEHYLYEVFQAKVGEK